MVFRAQGESPAPRSWKRRATCSRRVVRRVCSELIMWYGKLTILDFETPLAATRLLTRRLATSHTEVRDFPLGRLRLPSGSFANPTGKCIPLGAFGRRVGLSNRGSKSEWAHGWRGSLNPLGPSPLARRPRRVPLAAARGALRVLPLGGRATRTVRAPLPPGYLPKQN
jgi:hypothetical protein